MRHKGQTRDYHTPEQARVMRAVPGAYQAVPKSEMPVRWHMTAAVFDTLHKVEGGLGLCDVNGHVMHLPVKVVPVEQLGDAAKIGLKLMTLPR